MHHRIEKLRIGFKTNKYNELNATALTVYHTIGGLPMVSLNPNGKPGLPLFKKTCHLLTFTIPRGFQLMEAKISRNATGISSVKFSTKHTQGIKYLWRHDLAELQDTNALLVQLAHNFGTSENTLPDHPRRLAIPHNCEQQETNLIETYLKARPASSGRDSVRSLIGKMGACSSPIGNLVVNWEYSSVYGSDMSEYIYRTLKSVGYEQADNGKVYLRATSLPNNNIAWVPVEMNGSSVSERDLVYFDRSLGEPVYSLDRFAYIDGPDIFIGRLPDPEPKEEE